MVPSFSTIFLQSFATSQQVSLISTYSFVLHLWVNMLQWKRHLSWFRSSNLSSKMLTQPCFYMIKQKYCSLSMRWSPWLISYTKTQSWSKILLKTPNYLKRISFKSRLLKTKGFNCRNLTQIKSVRRDLSKVFRVIGRKSRSQILSEREFCASNLIWVRQVPQN